MTWKNIQRKVHHKKQIHSTENTQEKPGKYDITTIHLGVFALCASITRQCDLVMSYTANAVQFAGKYNWITLVHWYNNHLNKYSLFGFSGF